MIPGRRLLAAGAASACCLLLVAPPAWAAATLTLEEPAANEEGDRHFVEATEGKVVLAGEVSSEDGRIKDVDFSFDPPLNQSPIVACRIEPEKSVQVQSDETAVFELVLDAACNRKHKLKATVIHEGALDALGVPLPPPPPAESGTVEFGVAIPPAPVQQFGAKYNPDTKEVTLTWDPNTEPDLIGYRIERNPPGRSGFAPVTGFDSGDPGATTFVDKGIEDEHVYRITAVRSGPDGPIDGPVSSIVEVGPDNPEPTIPPQLLRDGGKSGNAGAGKSSGANRSRTGSSSRGGAAAPRPRTLTTAHDGFSQNLPFDPSQTTTVPPTSSTGDAAVLAEFDDDSGDDDRRATLVPVAGGLALLMGAAHMALLSKRAGEADIPIEPR